MFINAACIELRLPQVTSHYTVLAYQPGRYFKRAEQLHMNLPVVMQDGEHLVLLVRRHWMYLYPRLMGIIFLALVPVGAAAGGISAFAPVDPIVQQAATLVGIGWILCWGV